MITTQMDRLPYDLPQETVEMFNSLSKIKAETITVGGDKIWFVTSDNLFVGPLTGSLIVSFEQSREFGRTGTYK